MTAIIQFFTSHFFGNMVYGIINNLITFIFVWFIHAFIPYKPKYQSRKNLTRATLLLYIGLVIISYLREVPGNNAIPIFYLLMAQKQPGRSQQQNGSHHRQCRKFSAKYKLRYTPEHKPKLSRRRLHRIIRRIHQVRNTEHAKHPQNP